jgi:hypothetical protein
MRAEELAIFSEFGIHVPAHAEYVEPEWRRNFQLAMDAQPQLVTSPNSGIPAFLSNLLDPEVIRVLTAPMRAVEIYGETKKGTWTDLTTQFPVVESTGEISSYGDHNNNGSTGANVNFVSRQSYHYQTVTQWGERELDFYGLAKINYASELNVASAMTLNRFQNKSYFFGVANLQNYGGLNDPGLIASIAPATKTAGGVTWAVGTAQEIYTDVLALFSQLQLQMGGLVPDMDVKMTLAMSPKLAVLLKKVSIYNVTAEETIKGNFPGLTIKTAPEFSTASGELMQLILDEVDGVKTTYAAFTEKMRAHPVIAEMSAFRQKKSGGTWGTIIRRPIALASMIGM